MKMASRHLVAASAPRPLPFLLLPLLVFCIEAGMAVSKPVVPIVDQAGSSVESQLGELLARLERGLATEGSVDHAYRRLNATASEWMSLSKELLKAFADLYQIANASEQQPPSEALEDVKIPLMVIAAAVSGMYEGHNVVKQSALDQLWPTLMHGGAPASASSKRAGVAGPDFSGVSAASNPTNSFYSSSKTKSNGIAAATTTTETPHILKTPSSHPSLMLNDEPSHEEDNNYNEDGDSNHWMKTSLGKAALWIARLVNKGGDAIYTASLKFILLLKKLLSWLGV